MDAASIERMRPDGWERVRAIRLRALAESPDAFGTMLVQDEARPLEEWRTRLESPTSVTFLAIVEGRDVGIAVGHPHDARTRAAGLFSMWVAPESRGRGIASDLVDAVVAWARGGPYDCVLLDVASENAPAVQFYERKGFLPTGGTGTLPAPREHVLEHERIFVL